MGHYIRENIKISAKECIGQCEAKHHKPWFEEECLKLVDRRKQAKLQRLQDPSVVNEDNLSNVRWEASRHFKNKKIRDLYRGTNEFTKGYQPRTNLVKDEKGGLLADPHKIVNRWTNYFCKLLNVQWVGGY
jgi:hypothetical protein